MVKCLVYLCIGNPNDRKINVCYKKWKLFRKLLEDKGYVSKHSSVRLWCNVI